MDGTQVGVFEEGDKISLDGLLESTDCRRLEAQVGFEVLSDFTDQALEGQFADEELGRFLVATDLTESDSTYVLVSTDERCSTSEENLPGL